MRRLLSLLLIPLSALPIVAVTPAILHQRAHFRRVYEMTPLPAPAVGLSAAEQARFTPLPATPGAIPVLAWHGIGPARDGYTVSARAFARQLALLKHLGYTAISTARWQAFRAGRTAGLPAKPVLLTFDDGRLDSYRGADAILARFHMRAAMFVIAGHADQNAPFYLSWAELRRMQASGRWDIEPHAYDGHHDITVSASGAQAPFYAARQYTRTGGRESLAGWEARVGADIFTLEQRLAAHGFTPHAFAVPYGDYGQRSENDPRIAPLFSALLTRQFGSFFLEADNGDPGFSRPGRGASERYEVHTPTTLDDLYGWLRRHSVTDQKGN